MTESSNPSANELSDQEACENVAELLKELQQGQCPRDDSPETIMDQLLDDLCYKDFPRLQCACTELTVKSKDRKLDVFFRSHITSMVATLNLYLDAEFPTHGTMHLSLQQKH